MEHRPMPSLALYLPHIDLLKIDSKEAKYLCGTENLREACTILAEVLSFYLQIANGGEKAFFIGTSICFEASWHVH
jgi:hypothetical protein